jgi:tRNA pseudouridine55 synthase
MRRGELTAPPPREVRIDAIDVEGFDPVAQRATIHVRCSKGTYVRQIAADLGAATGAGAYCLALRRLTVGPFSLDDAGTPDQILEQPSGPWFRPPREALPHLPERTLTADECGAVRHGRAISGEAAGTVRLVHDGELIAVAAPREQGLQPVVVLQP